MKDMATRPPLVSIGVPVYNGERHLAEAHPGFNKDRTVVLVPETRALLPQSVQGAATSLVAILMGVVSFVLLIACANVANLQMARAKARENEVGLRLALGAGRGRPLRQLLTESLVLAVLAGAAGVALAWAIHRGILSIPLPVGAPVRIEVGIDWRVLAFTSLVTLLAAVAFGLAPAMRATSAPPASAARIVPRSRFAGVLVTGQMALSLVLLIGAGLMLTGAAGWYHAPHQERGSCRRLNTSNGTGWNWRCTPRRCRPSCPPASGGWRGSIRSWRCTRRSSTRASTSTRTL